MAHYNHKLISQIDKFFKLAQQAAPDDDLLGSEEDDDKEQTKLDLQNQWISTRRELANIEKQYEGGTQALHRDIRQRRGLPQQGQQAGQQGQQGQQQAQPVTAELNLVTSLQKEIYSSLKGSNGTYRGYFNGEKAGRVIELIDAKLLHAKKVREFATEDRLRFNVSVTIGTNLSVGINLTSTNTNYDTQYSQFFNYAKSDLTKYLQPLISNNIRAELQTNNLKLEIPKQMVISTWFIVEKDGKLHQMS